MSEALTVSEFARRSGCDEKQVRRALQKGRLRKGSAGLLDEAQLSSGWRRPNRRTRAGAGEVSDRSVRNGSDISDIQGATVRTTGADVRSQAAVVRAERSFTPRHERDGFHLGWACGGPGLGDDVPLMAAEAVLDAGGDLDLAKRVFEATLTKVQDRLRELAAFDSFEPEADVGDIEGYWLAEHFTVPDWSAPRPWPRTDL